MIHPMNFPLMAISPLDGRYATSTEPLQAYFSESALFKYRFFVEVQWFIYLLKQILGSQSVEKLNPAFVKLENLAKHFHHKDAEAIKVLEQKYQHDVKAVEYYLKEHLTKIPELHPYQEWVHFACTSEDINNLAYALMLKEALNYVIFPELYALVETLKSKASAYAAVSMLSRTHGQPATPTTLGKEFANYVYRLERLLKRLHTCPILGKFNGAVGNFNAHFAAFPQFDWPKVNQMFVERLGLSWNSHTTQIEPHDYVAEIFSIFGLIQTVLIDFCQDMWSYISLSYFLQSVHAEEVGSSTMPHKVNPIHFENAEGNLSVSQALGGFLAQRLPRSRFQRDLVDSTLMRNLGLVFGYALVAYKSLNKGLNRIALNELAVAEDLAKHPEVLAEAIQTVMRAHHLEMPYEALKTLTRGHAITLEDLKDFIQNLPLPEPLKQELLALTPDKYIGCAIQLAQDIGNEK